MNRWMKAQRGEQRDGEEKQAASSVEQMTGKRSKILRNPDDEVCAAQDWDCECGGEKEGKTTSGVKNRRSLCYGCPSR